MKTYIKLLRIKYNDKIFDIFSDQEHRKTFLEVKIENNEEKYYSPTLNDYINLELIYNKSEDDILCSKKYSFSDIVVLSGIITILVSNLKILDNNIDNNYQLTKEYQDYAIVVEQKELPSNNYYKVGKNVFILNNDALTELGYNQVTFDEVRNTLAENKKLNDDYKEKINVFIDRLEERMPEVDLRVFNENLKTLRIRTIENDKWIKKDVDAYYTINTNIITLKSSYDEYNEYINGELVRSANDVETSILFHELCHTLNNSTIRNTNSIGKIENYIYKRFHTDNNYGRSFTEGFNNVLTDYLLDDDWENYFTKKEHYYSTYPKISYIDYQIISLLDDYDLYSYLNGNISELEDKLKKYNLEEIITALDANLETNNSITELDKTLLDQQIHNLTRYKVTQLVNSGYDDLEIYEVIKKMDSSHNQGITECTELLNNIKSDWSIRIIEQEKTVNHVLISKNGTPEYKDVITFSDFSKVNIYDNDDNLLFNRYYNNFYISIKFTDNSRKYNLIYITTENDNLCYKDAFTNEVIISDNSTKIIALDSILSKYSNCNFHIKESFLNSKQLDKYISDYFGINPITEENKLINNNKK